MLSNLIPLCEYNHFLVKSDFLQMILFWMLLELFILLVKFEIISLALHIRNLLISKFFLFLFSLFLCF